MKRRVARGQTLSFLQQTGAQHTPHKVEGRKETNSSLVVVATTEHAAVLKKKKKDVKGQRNLRKWPLTPPSPLRLVWLLEPTTFSSQLVGKRTRGQMVGARAASDLHANFRLPCYSSHVLFFADTNLPKVAFSVTFRRQEVTTSGT